MPKRLSGGRLSFVRQTKMRRAKAAGANREEPSQSKGVRLSRDGRIIMNRTEQRRTAYHEAGHAVINAVLGSRFRYVTIVPSGKYLGRVVVRDRHWRYRRLPRAQIERAILIRLAGGIAEQLVRCDGQASGVSEDVDVVRRLIRHLPGCRTISGRVRRHIEMYRRADALVRRHWRIIDDVAEMLLRDKTLTESQVLAVAREEHELEAKIAKLTQALLSEFAPDEVLSVPLEYDRVAARIDQLIQVLPRKSALSEELSVPMDDDRAKAIIDELLSVHDDA